MEGNKTMATTTMARYGVDPTNPAHVAAAWASLAEPGDAWAGHLRQTLGSVEALEWATSPYTELGLNGPGNHFAHEVAWKNAWQRWNLGRIETPTVKTDLRQLADLGGRLILPGTQEWPTQLDALGNTAPPALWVLGKAPINTDPNRTVSVAGARAATHYGEQITHTLAGNLAAAGATIVSGGAYGIDSTAHRAALNNATEMDTAKTIAIVCGGLQNLYPTGNAELFTRIIEEGGAIVAEVRPSARPARGRFLERNRLIAAWSNVTLIPEAGLRSGAMATAQRATKLHRKVAAVPGPITSFSSQGPHELIRTRRAHITTTAEEVQALLA